MRKWLLKRAALFALGALRKVVRLNGMQSDSWRLFEQLIEEL